MRTRGRNAHPTRLDQRGIRGEDGNSLPRSGDGVGWTEPALPRTTATIGAPLTRPRLPLMRQRPLSPHLQAYRLPGTALLSISHRISGVVLTVGTVLGSVLLLALAFDQNAFEQLRDAIATPIGRGALWLWLYAFLFHLCHGVRHLLWDIGWGFERERMRRYVILELVGSVLLLFGVFVTSQILT